MKVLIIAYDFYPENKPNAYRWFNVAMKWQKEGAEVFVITASKSQYLPFEEMDGLKIYRSTEYFVGNFKYKYRDNVKGEHKVFNNDTKSRIKLFFKKIVRKIYDFTWSKLYWPDYSFLWYFSSVPLASKIIKEQEIEKLITVSWTFTSHLIGYRLKKKFNSMFWLADTIDIFCFNGKINNLFLYNRINRRIERRIFLNSDYNTVLTHKIKQQYIKIFPDVIDKIGVIHNVFMPNSFDYESEACVDSKTIKMLFLGTLTEEVRSPKRMLSVFDKLITKYPDYNFVLNFYGEFTDTIDSFNEYAHLLDKSVFLHGFISRDEVNLAIKNTDVLLNVGNKNEFQEPSKLIEYMYSCKKILNFCSITEDTSLELLEKYQLKHNILSNEDCNDNLLTRIFSFLTSSEKLDKELLKRILKNYLLDEVADNYMNIIKKDLDKRDVKK